MEEELPSLGWLTPSFSDLTAGSDLTVAGVGRLTAEAPQKTAGFLTAGIMKFAIKEGYDLFPVFRISGVFNLIFFLGELEQASIFGFIKLDANFFWVIFSFVFPFSKVPYLFWCHIMTAPCYTKNQKSDNPKIKNRHFLGGRWPSRTQEPHPAGCNRGK